MSLIEEARSQLDVEATLYIRSAQQSLYPTLPSPNEPLLSLSTTQGKRPAAGVAATISAMANTAAAFPASTAASAQRSAATDTKKAAKSSGDTTAAVAATTASSGPRASNPKQARARLQELVKKLQRATFVAVQASKEEAVVVADAGDRLSRRGSHAEILSRKQSSLSLANLRQASSPAVLPTLPSMTTTAPPSRSKVGPKGKQISGKATNAAAAAGAASGAAATAPAGEKRADMRVASPHLPPPSSTSLADTQRSQSFHRRHRDTERSHSAATSATSRDRSASPSSGAMAAGGGGGGGANSAAALRRLEASLMFANDCLQYASNFAEAGLMHEAQGCFLQPIAQDMANLYEPIVARCVERRPRSSARQTQQQQQQQQQQLKEMANAAATSSAQDPRRRRMSKGKGLKDGQKHNGLSAAGDDAAAGHTLLSPNAPSSEAALAAEAAMEGGVRMTDTIDVFASDVPLPLALQVYKCVLRHRALATFIRFRELLQSDLYGDAAGMATSVAAVACLEELVAQQQRVLHTTTFCAAVLLRSETARILEDVAHTAAAKPVNAIVVAGGCKLVDLLAEPAAQQTRLTSLSLSTLSEEPPILLYPVEEVAAPVLLRMRLYIAVMCEQLFGYTRSTTTREVAQTCAEVRTAVFQRSLEALRTSVSMSELHLGKAGTPGSTAAETKGQQQQQQQSNPRSKTCLPLATVEYLPWRLQEYTLLQQGYQQLEDGTAAAVTAAEHALQQVLQLVELEYLDPVPPPPTTTAALDAAVQQCASWLLVAMWHAAVAQGSSSVSTYIALSSATPTSSLTQPPAQAQAADQGGDFSPGGDAPPMMALQMAATARTAMAAITAVVQQAVAYLVTAQWTPTHTAPPSHALGAGEGMQRRGSRRGGPNTAAATAATAAVGAGSSVGGVVSDGFTAPAMNGTRLLVALWTCFAHVQQQCSLLVGRPAVAEALAAAAKDTDYIEGIEDGGEETSAEGRSPGRTPGQSPAAHATMKRSLSKSPPPPTQQQQQQRKANGKGKPSPAGAAASSTSGGGGDGAIGKGGEAADAVPSLELRHAHPVVAFLAALFPRMAMEVLLQLVGVVEAAGAVPQAPAYTGGREGKRGGTKAGEGGGAGGPEGTLMGRKLNESPERRSARGGRRRASSIAIAGDSVNSVFNAAGGGGFNAGAGLSTAAFKLRALQGVYHGCVEALEVLLHAAAVKATESASSGRAAATTAGGAAGAHTSIVPPPPPPAASLTPFLGSATMTPPRFDNAAAAAASSTAFSPAAQSLGPLSVLTRAAVWNDAVDVLGYCDETAAEGQSFAGRGGALYVAETSLPPAPQQSSAVPEARTFASVTQLPAVCFLYNPADTRCLLRHVSWTALFTSPEKESSSSGFAFSAKSLAEGAVSRAVTALRTVSFASPRLAVAVRVGLSMETWCRAQLVPPPAGKAAALSAAATTITTSPTTAIKTVAPVAATAGKKAATVAASTAVEAALRCVQLLRAVLLAALLHLHQQQQLPAVAHGRLKRESPLTSVLRLFEAAASALDVVDPAVVVSSPSTPAGAAVGAATAALTLSAPSLSSFPAGEVCQPGEQQPASSRAASTVHVHSEADAHLRLTAEAQTALQLSIYQRRPLRDPSGHTTVALREYYERNDVEDAQADAGGDAWSSPSASHTAPPSMSFYKASALLIEKVTSALCPASSDGNTAHNSSSNGSSSSSNNSTTLPVTSCAALLLQPITSDAGSFLLRCSEALRAQWQHQRARRLLQDVGHDSPAVAAAAGDNMTTSAVGRTTLGATGADTLAASMGPREPSLLLEEQEAREEAFYATIVWSALSFLWRSGGSGAGGAPRLEESGVAAITRRVSSGFLQLLPTSSSGEVACRIAPVALTRLLAHGAMVRRLLELSRSHLQAHVESLVRHTPGTTAVPVGHGRAYPHKTTSNATAAQLASQHRSLVHARDGVTELTHTWVAVRWQLARLKLHHADYAARHADLETLQQRHDQHRVFGRPTAKELRIQQTLEHDAPLLPLTANDEEVRLKRWVKDQQHAATGTSAVGSCLLLEALVCAALVPLNQADPAAQQKLVDEAIRALSDAEKHGGGETTHRPGSGSGVNNAGAANRGAVAPSAVKHTQEASAIYNSVLLWCYLADACSRCGTAEQTARVRGVLDRHLLTETPEIKRPSAPFNVPMTAPFVQKLLLQPRWAVLEDCSTTTRVAFCRALSALASRAASSSAAASASALGSLQSAYRLLLALQIQRMPDPSSAAGAALPPLRTGQGGSDKKRTAEHPGFSGGLGDAVARHGPSSKLTLSSAQQLLAAITEYLTRSSGGASTAGTGSPAAALLLPLLVELCNVLLHLPASSPQWADAEVQLFALRVLLLFKRQQLAVLTASPSPLTSATVTGTSATAAAAAATGMMDAFLQLLWTTFAHVWNSVFRNPNARQRRCIAASAHTTQWARRVLEQHRRQTLQMAAGHDRDADGSGSGGGAESAATGKHPRSPRKAGGGGGTSIAADGTAAAGSVDAAAGAPAMPFDDAGGNALTFAGVAYLPESDERTHREEDGAAVGGGNDSESPERRRVSPGRPKSSSPAHPSGGSSGAVSSLPTVSLHSHMPSEFMELLEDILLHLPQLWSYLLAPPGAVPIPAVATAANRPVGADVSPGRAALPPNPSSQSATLTGAAGGGGGGGGGGEAASRMDTQYDFVHYAAVQAVQALRESQRSSAPASGSSAAASTSGERRASAHVTAGGLLCGVPPIYMDVVAALQQYSVTMASSSSSNGGAVSGGGGGSAAAANGSSAQQNANSNAAGSTAAGGGGGGGSGARGGNARGAGGAVAVPAVSAACLTLIESLQRHKEDPAYAKLAVHVVRALLSLCCDEGSSGAFVSAVNGSGGGAGGGAAGGGGANAANSSGSRKKNPASGTGGGGAAAGAGGIGDAFSAGLRCNAGISASAVTTDVQCIIRAVREQAHENHRALRAFLGQVDDETHAWLVRGGYSLAGQAQQLQQQQSGGSSGQAGGVNTSATPPSTADAARGSKGKTAAAGAATNASAGSAGKKGAKKGNKKGAAGRGRKSDGNEDASDDDDEATRNGDDAQQSAAGVPYSTVTRAFSFAEEQKLKQLTCAMARWRRSRAGRLLRGRYVQYNTPFLAQLHLIEAVLLFMGAAVQQDVVRQRAVMHELLAFSEGAGGDAQLAGGAAAAAASSSSSTARGVQRDKKKPGGPPLSARSPEEAEVDDPTAVTEELLRHCAAASNLFQSVWMPVRASTAVQLAVQHLRQSPLQTRSTAASSGASATPAATTAFGLSSSSSKKAQGGKLSPAAALVAQLLTVPLFAMAAVQLGYHDARRDVHTCVLQPTVVKVGAAASWSQRDAFAYAVPSLFSLVSPVGVKGEEAMVQQGRLQAQRQRHYERLRLLWCVEAETDTRAEAVRDELQARVRIIQQAQQVLLPTPTHTTFLKARLVSAAELLALAPERQRNADSALRVKRASGETAGALTQGRESSHAPVNGGGATPNPPSFHYSLFDGALGAPVFGTADNAAPAKKGKSVKEGSDGPAAAPVVDGGRYGRDMAEAVLVQQLIALAHEVERESPQLCMQAYRTAQQLTAGRHATELLPRLMQMEEADNNCGRDAAIAYEKVLRGISDGVWLLRTARETRRQLLPLGGSLGRSGRSGDGSSSVGGGGDGPSSWKVVVDAFQRAAKALRAAGNLQLLGECLYELGNLHCAAGRIDEAERNWSDAVDCFLSTPHVLEEWHTHRAIPPPPPSTSPSSVSSGRGVAELLWVMAALTALADHAYATDAARFHDAQSLCALLVHKYWRLPAVVASGSAEDGAKGPAMHHNALLPPSAYSQLDVTSMGIHVGSSAAKTSPEQRSTATAMPDTLALTVHALIRTAHVLLHRRCSGDATIIAAFSDFVATVHLRDVSLAVSARLARAMAAAELGGFAVAMRHIHSVCVGTGLPQPVGGLLSEDGLPGYYSISAAVAAAIAARVVGASSSSSSSMSAGAKKPMAGIGAAAGAGGGGGGVAGGGGGSSPSPAGGPSTNNSGNVGGGAAAALSGAPATALPSSVISFFYLYRDHESPSTQHNTAAVRAFLLACLPGLAVDAALPTISANSRSAFAASASVPLTGGLLASPALESLYGVCLLRNVHLSIAELLVRLGTCDPIFLFRSPSGSPLTGSSAAGGPHATTARDATTTVTSASTSAAAAAAGAVNAAGTASSAAAATGMTAAASASGVSFPPLATGERPTNACTEACRYAQLLLQSLRSADIRFAISGQPSAASGLNSADDTDGAAAAAAAAVTGRATRTQGEASSTSRSREAVNKDVVATVTSPPEAERDITERPECMACLVRLGVIRQRAILLTSEILAAQGQYSACLQLLTSIVVEFNDAQAGLPNAAAQSSSAMSGTSSSYAGRPAPSTAPSRSLRDYGMQGSRSCSRPRRRTAVASLPAPYTYVYWAYVWQLVCRCYCALRLFPQLESAAKAQGLQLCATSGDTSTNRNIFQLYRLYALGQMGRMREAAEVASDLHRSLNSAPPIESPAMRAGPAGMTDDGSVATALQWWVMQHPGDGPSLWSPALGSQRVVAQLTAVAVATRCLLPWRAVSTSPPMLVLESPNAESVVPPCPLSGCVKTRDAWRLHAAMIRCAFEMKWRPPPSAPSLLPSSSVERAAADRGSGGGMTGSSHQRSPQPPPPRLLSSTRGAGAINGRSAASPVPLADAQAAAAAAVSSESAADSASWLLRESVEGLCPQYTAQAHPIRCLESRIVSISIRNMDVAQRLQARQQEAVAATVEFAVDDGEEAPAEAIAEVCRAPPSLTSRDAALAALPVPVRDICTELLQTLQLFVQYPVQQHMSIRVLLISIAGVLSVYIRSVRLRCRSGRIDAALAEAEALLPQYAAIVAACTLLAGLVSDMERRIRTGADSFRGYFTDPRLSSSDGCETLALLLESQWPESLSVAVRQTHATVGQLQAATGVTHDRNSNSNNINGASPATAHPFYTLPAVQQQIFGIAVPTAAAAPGTAAGGAPGAGSGGGGSRGGSAGSRDAGGASKRSASQPSAGGTGAGTAGSAGISSPTVGPAASPLLSVPALALTFAALSDEAAAVQALTPVGGALEHDVVMQLLTAHLQALSPPVNCTYLCYRDDVRQQLLEAVGATLGQQQQLQQQQQQSRTGQRRTSNTATKRPGGPTGASGNAGGATQSRGAASGAPAVAFSDADVWKALVPPVMLASVPADLFSALGPDTLGAPLYNSVAAAGLEMLVYNLSAAAGAAGKKRGTAESGGAETTTSMWRLHLAVSPLNDPAVVEAPLMSPNTSTIFSAADAAVLLPPAHLVAAVNGGGTDGAGAGGGGGVSLSSAAFMTGGGGNASTSSASASAAASARGRGMGRPSGAAAFSNTNAAAAAAAAGIVSPQRRSSGQESSVVGNGGCVWPPLSAAACLVPSTNWAYLDQIQQEGLSMSPSGVEEGGGIAAATTAAVKATSPAAGNRAHTAVKATRGINASTAGGSAPLSTAAAAAASECGKSSSTIGDHMTQAHSPLRWNCVSLELSIATMSGIQRHLRRLLRCMHRAKEVDSTMLSAAPVEVGRVASDGAALSKASTTALAAAKGEAADGGRGAATRTALAAAVSRAQQTLRAHLAAAGVAAAAAGTNAAGGGGGVGGSGGGGSSVSASALSASAAGGSVVSGGGPGTAAGGSGAAAASGTAASARKAAARLAGAASVAQRSSGGPVDSALGAAAATSAHEGGAASDDLTEELRERQTAQRERLRQQCAEELEEAQRSLLRELLEAVVAAAAAGTGEAAAVMDEARVEMDVQRLLPRCPLSASIVDFLCDWLGGVTVAGSEAEGSDGADGASGNPRPLSVSKSNSGTTALRFYNAGLHAWMQRIVQYVVEQQQQQQRPSRQSGLR